MHPGAVEYCNEVDDNCDGELDNSSIYSWWLDDDGDGYGDPGMEFLDGCNAATPYLVSNDEDCDDTDEDINPDAQEICDGLDDDCDGLIDDEDSSTDPSTMLEWWADSDADGFGDESVAVLTCDPPSGYVADDTACDDSTGSTFPGADEYCNEVDDDCDGAVDEDDALDVITWYADSDGDTFGDANVSDIDCDQPSGYVEDDTDCDDSEANAYPGNAETCDGIDTDCDGSVDPSDSVDVSTWYYDMDLDGFGNASVTVPACSQPSGYVSDDTDCDDSDGDTYPGADEYCDGHDDDCDGDTDEDDAVDASTWYEDNDGDSYGNVSVTDVECYQPSGYVSDDTDCDDNANSVNPGASEVCNSIDDDCDSSIDEGVTTTFWADADADGYGDSTSTTEACSVPSGYVAASSDVDCDDTDSSTYPGADEYCDGVDTDCDGTLDEDDALDASTWYADSDSDGYGDASASTSACSQPSGYVSDTTDCNDTDSSVYPGADEYCDSVDNDCDGDTDEDEALDATTWYADKDSDGYGDASDSDVECYQPSGYVSLGTDCDDTDSDDYPGADEYCDGVDNDCDGTTDEDDAVDADTWYADSDLDGYGDASVFTSACSQPSGYVSDDTDCDDAEIANFPGNTEVCDGIDNDCDGSIDDDDSNLDTSTATTWYRDEDGDGHGAESTTDQDVACDQPSGYSSSADDCDDEDEDLSPSAEEVCTDGIDNDCDELVDCDDDDCSGFTDTGFGGDSGETGDVDLSCDE